MNCGRVTEAFARRRVPIGFVAGVVVLWLSQPTDRSLAIGVGVACLGEAFRIWASGHLNKAREVTASGPYQYVAHPLYVGSSILGAGLALATDSVAVGVVVALYLAVTLTAAVASEEALLEKKFGARYRDYRRGSGGAGGVDRARRFSVRQALANHEHRTVAGLAVALLLLFLKATYNGMFWGVAAGR